MIVDSLTIRNFRLVSNATFEFHPHLNIIYGPNGSGKTALLEALYMLSTGHSFRTREWSPVVKRNENLLSLQATLSQSHTLRLIKSLQGPTKVQINGQACLNSSELTFFFPCQLIYHDIFLIIDAGPTVRRALLDRGLFHVKQFYSHIWKAYKQVLKQRNALLKRKPSRYALAPWDEQLVQLAEELHTLRKHYFLRWSESFQQYLPRLADLDCEIQYYKGWDRKNSGISLGSILNEQFEMDLQQEYTHSGAHQADILIASNQDKIKHVFSRGQQKIILIALMLAQGALLERPCVYLMDDVASEIDYNHLSRLMECIQTHEGQFFLTWLDDHFDSMFSLKEFKRIKLCFT